MSAPTAEIVERVERKQSPAFGERGIVIRSMDEAWRMATAIVASGFAPRGMEKPEAAFVAIQMGLEVGLSPMAAIRSIAVINNRPAIYGDAALALVRASGLIEYITERIDGAGDAMVATCTIKRKSSPQARASTFSVEDAKRANLWGKAGPWQQYPKRMLQFRARGFALRDEFGDVLQGLVTAEEAGDMPAEPTIALIQRVDEAKRHKLLERASAPSEPAMDAPPPVESVDALRAAMEAAQARTAAAPAPQPTPEPEAQQAPPVESQDPTDPLREAVEAGGIEAAKNIRAAMEREPMKLVNRQAFEGLMRMHAKSINIDLDAKASAVDAINAMTVHQRVELLRAVMAGKLSPASGQIKP